MSWSTAALAAGTVVAGSGTATALAHALGTADATTPAGSAVAATVVAGAVLSLRSAQARARTVLPVSTDRRGRAQIET